MIYHDPRSKSPRIPDPIGHRANKRATQALEAGRSRRAFQRELEREINHPTQRKISEAVNSRRILIYGLLAMTLPFLVAWEWNVSKEIYQVWFPAQPWFPFVTLTIIALFISCCMGESFGEFSFGARDTLDHTDVDDIAEELFDLEPKRKYRFKLVHPITGMVLGTVFLLAIYLGSQERVRLLVEAGEARESTFQILLPVLLYATEIIIGIPAFFFFVFLYCTLKTRSLRKELTFQTSAETTLRRTGLEDYHRYINALTQYNSWARANHRTERSLIPAGRELHTLLEEHGYYRNTNGEAPEPEAGGSDSTNETGNRVPTGESSEVSGNSGRSREEDLINLVDEHIENANRTI